MSFPLKKSSTKHADLEDLFLNELKSIKRNEIIVKKAEQASPSSIGSIEQEALNSIQNLFDKAYNEGGYKQSMSFGKEMSGGLRSEKIYSILDHKHEKQVTGELAEKALKATGAIEMLKGMNLPKADDSNSKEAVVSVWKEAWNSIKKNISILGSIFGSIFDSIIGYFERYPWIVAVGYALWKLAKKFGRHLSKIFKFMKLIPGVSIVIDISLAIKNVFYIVKELASDDWNNTMSEIGQESLMITEFEFAPSINYPGNITRVIGESIKDLTNYLIYASSMGFVATKCLGAGFVVADAFNSILEYKEKEFLSGTISSSDFANSVAMHIKASRKVKVVCSEMIGLVCNTASAAFDLVTAVPGGVLVTIIGNLVIAGIDMGLREGIIVSCKTFEDFWTKKLLDYQKVMSVYFNFANDADKRLSGTSSNNNFNKQLEMKKVEEEMVSQEEIASKNEIAGQEAKDDVMNKKTAKRVNLLTA